MSASPAFSLQDTLNLNPARAWELIRQYSGDPGFILLDVRTPGEIKTSHIPGMQGLDYYAPGFQAKLDSLDLGKSYLVFCHTGARSAQTVKYLRAIGHKDVYNMVGGLVAWQAQSLPLEKGN